MTVFGHAGAKSMLTYDQNIFLQCETFVSVMIGYGVKPDLFPLQEDQWEWDGLMGIHFHLFCLSGLETIINTFQDILNQLYNQIQ